MDKAEHKEAVKVLRARMRSMSNLDTPTLSIDDMSVGDWVVVGFDMRRTRNGNYSGTATFRKGDAEHNVSATVEGSQDDS